MSDKSAFAGLIDDLKGVQTDTETMAKSIEDKGAAIEGADEDDAEIAAAAAAADADKDGAEKAEGKDGEKLAKSFTITLEDGTEVEAVDGADLVKSLMARIEKTESDNKEALTMAVETIKGQGLLIKSLTDHVNTLGGQSRPRKAVLSVTEKPAPAADLAKSLESPNTINSEELMAKAMVAQADGRVTGMQIAVAEQMIQSGQSPDEAFLRAVLTTAG